MADRPILFSAPMVRALLAGTKTQTRRTVRSRGSEVSMEDTIRVKVGDRLWVRESFRGSKGYDNYPPRTWSHWPVHYEADGEPDHRDEMEENGRLRPGIHMPRWASRLTLTVTNVRVERLNNISDMDAIAEGIDAYDGIDADCWGYLNYANNSEDGYWLPPKASYASLWNHINGAGAWEANPWIVAYSFSVHHGNIDQIAQVAA